MALAVGREEELLAQLHALLFLPSPAPAATPATPAVKVESAAGPLAANIIGSGGGRGRGRGRGRRPAAPSSAMAAAAEADASSCGGGGGRGRRRLGSNKSVRDDCNAKDEKHDEEPAAAQPHYPPPCKRRKKKQHQQSSKCLVTSVPDFDGYQWRKYGQKQIEGAMYPRSYYRCTRSAEQGCLAKRTVQRNDDDGGDGATAAAPEYTVVYVAEHTCTANDSLEAPVILETTVVVVPAATNTYTDSFTVPTTSAGSCSTTATTSTRITTGIESPAISGDDITCWSSTSGASSDCNNYAADDYYCGGLFAAVHGGGWATEPVDASSSSSLQEMEDLTGPIRSPVHVPAAGCWTVDQLLLQLVNEPVCHF